MPAPSPKRRLASLGASLALLACAVAATAQPSPPAQPSPGASGSSVPVRLPSTALGATSTSIAGELRAHVSSALVVAGPVRSDSAAPRANELSAKIASLVAGSLGVAFRSSPTPASLESAREAAQSFPALVYLELEIAQGRLRISADVYPIPSNIWDRCRNPKPDPIAHAAAQASLDAELRSYLSPVPLVASRPLVVSGADKEAVALLCDDFDGDGSLELFSLGRRTISTGRIRKGAYEILRKVAWETLSPIAPVPLRQPLAFAVVHEPGRIDIGTTDRAKSIRLDPMLNAQSSLDGLPIPFGDSSACTRVGPSMLLADRLEPCKAGDARPIARDSGVLFDASASTKIVDKQGSTRSLWALRSPADGKLSLRDDTGLTASLKNVGAQLAVGDLDLDGDAELVASRDVLDERNDALVVRTWRRDGSIQHRYEIAVPSGISALAICPPENNGLRTVVVATKGELWLVR